MRMLFLLDRHSKSVRFSCSFPCCSRHLHRATVASAAQSSTVSSRNSASSTQLDRPCISVTRLSSFPFISYLSRLTSCLRHPLSPFRSALSSPLGVSRVTSVTNVSLVCFGVSSFGHCGAFILSFRHFSFSFVIFGIFFFILSPINILFSSYLSSKPKVPLH